MATAVRTVHVVAKTHLDLGFTALAAEVEDRYLRVLFPAAIATAAELERRGAPERLVWTTGSWILERALADPDEGRAAAVAAAVEAGHLAWHALPLTFHTELMDAPLVRTALGISADLDARFGRTTTAAKMTDVPGHTRGLVPLLAEAGVTFLHLGVNPAWPVPDVPAVFRWRAPDGSEVVVAHRAGGYGGEVVVEGCDHALAFLHAGDNSGPPTAAEVVEAHAALARRHPGAAIVASTLDAFARALDASGAAGGLPVVTAEIGDPWLFGAGSDPQKVAAFRAALRGERSPEVDRRLLLVAEHTWGLDQKEALPDTEHWSAADLVELRSTPAARRFEASWAEQRSYLDGLRRGRSVEAVPSGGDHAAGVPVGQVVAMGAWEAAIDDRGALIHLRDRADGRVLADREHPLGLLAHQTFSAADYERFYAQLTPAPEDDGWARWDNTKPGLERTGATSSWASGSVVAAWVVELSDADAGWELEVAVQMPAEHVASGAAPVAHLRWRFPLAGSDSGGGEPLALEVRWEAKPASRLPEATWVSFVPTVAVPERWLFDKLGQDVSPLDVVRHGGRSLHAVGERGARCTGPDGRLVLRTLDAPLMAPGAPNLLDADPPVPELSGGLHVLLHDNCWGTNFPMWNEGPARFRFELDPS